MTIQYLEPLSRAWQRTKLILFQPFAFEKWLGLGFTAWLATLGENTSSGGRTVLDAGDDDHRIRRYDHDDVSDWAGDTVEAARDFFASGLEATIVGILVLLCILVALLVVWLSSRGHFMFLDNVVHNRSRVVDPWRRLGHLGDSLFFWRLVVGGICFLFFAGLAVAGLLSWLPAIADDDLTAIGVLGMVLLGLVAVAVGLLFAFMEMLLYHFVVPLMYRYNIGVLEGWRSFLTLLQRETVYFVLYAAFLLVIYLVLGVAVVMIGLMTCCLGFLAMMVLAVPVIGATLMLPFHVTWRGLGLEFMAQFGDDFRVLPRGDDHGNDLVPADGDDGTA